MKNTFSKTLICGVIASSFILVNCQKAPSSRGVKGGKGTPNTTQTPAGEKATVETPVSALKCNDDFKKSYPILQKTMVSAEVVKFKAAAKEEKELNETKKDELLKLNTRYNDETETVLKEFEVMQDAEKKLAETKKAPVKTVEDCYIDERSKVAITKKSIVENRNQFAAITKKLTGKDVEHAAEGEADQKTRLADKIKSESDVTNTNTELFASETLNNLLEKGKFEEAFFVDKSIKTGEKAKEDAIEKKGESVCFITESHGKVEDLKKPFKPVLVAAGKIANSKREYEISFTQVDNSYMIKCVIPVSAKINDQFRTAFGHHFKTKKQLGLSTTTETKTQAEKDQEAADKKKIEDAAAQVKKDQAAVNTQKATNEAETKAQKAANDAEKERLRIERVELETQKAAARAAATSTTQQYRPLAPEEVHDTLVRERLAQVNRRRAAQPAQPVATAPTTSTVCEEGPDNQACTAPTTQSASTTTTTTVRQAPAAARPTAPVVRRPAPTVRVTAPAARPTVSTECEQGMDNQGCTAPIAPAAMTPEQLAEAVQDAEERNNPSH